MEKPRWLNGLLETSVEDCEAHKKIKTEFCFRCCFTICDQCRLLHQTHRTTQVKRYRKQTAIPTDAIEDLLNCSGIQQHKHRNTDLIFLKKWDESNQNMKRPCSNCLRRSIQEHYNFCSLQCKLSWEQAKGELTSIIKVTEFSSEEDEEENGNNNQLIDRIDQDTPDMDAAGSSQASGQLTISSNQPINDGDRKTSNEQTVHTRRNRRKGIPRRSPFF